MLDLAIFYACLSNKFGIVFDYYYFSIVKLKTE